MLKHILAALALAGGISVASAQLPPPLTAADFEKDQTFTFIRLSGCYTTAEGGTACVAIVRHDGNERYYRVRVSDDVLELRNMEGATLVIDPSNLP